MIDKCEKCNENDAEIDVEYKSSITKFSFSGYICYECEDKINEEFCKEVK